MRSPSTVEPGTRARRQRIDLTTYRMVPAGGSREAFGRLLPSMGGTVVHAPQEAAWAPGYYSLLFEDPCGTRLEINHVPGKGNLDPDVTLPLPQDLQAQLSQR